MTISTRWLEEQFPELGNFQPIGKGGQKEAFKAEAAPGDLVVVKVFHLGSNPDRALREIQAVVGLASSRVPRILDFGKTRSPLGDLVWVKEEFIDSESLRERLARGPLSVAEAMAVARDVLEVLVLAEQAHIVHRDIKPENILIAPRDGAYLLDFGLARHLDLPSMTASSVLEGPNTPGYAPPEQFKNLKRDIDSRTDMFGLGVTLYEAIVGVNPYWAGTSDRREVARRVDQDTFPPLPTSPAVPDELRQLVSAMTRRRPGHRPRTLRDCLDWLNEAFAQMESST